MTTSVLIVDDEIIIATGIEKQLKGLSYAVAALALSGEEAVQKAVELRPDIVLMDIKLGPGMDGVEAADVIRKRTSIPVVYLTAYSDDATIQRAKITEPFGYVLKPYEDGALRTAIEVGLHKYKMERQLRENKQRLAATLSSIGDAVIALNSQGRVSFMNPLAERLTGWTLADVLGRHVSDVLLIVEKSTRNPVPNPALKAIARGENVALPENTILIHKDGSECFIDDSAAPIWDDEGGSDGAVLVFRDITERRLLHEHLRQAQKMEAIGRLAGGIAHDFNNFMTVIIGYGELLRAEGMPADQRLSAVDQICAAGNRAAALTQQIMAFSRKQLLVPRVLNLSTFVQDMTATVQRLVGANIEFITEMEPDLGKVKVDPTQMEQVILNLAANARDAMPGGGRLVVATANTELGEATVRLNPDVTPGRYALLSVTDTGTGMSETILAQVFEPFFTTKGVGQGTGMGLASVHGIVKQSGGHIEVTSKIGSGTTFRVYLPLVEEPTPGCRELPLAEKDRETILLVEDEEAVRKLTKLVLEQNGYSVLEASSGVEAVRVAGDHPGPIHLLLTDLVMPELSGREVVEQLSNVRRGMRVLFMTGYSDDVITDLGMEAATTDFLHKPFPLVALTNMVRKVLDRP